MPSDEIRDPSPAAAAPGALPDITYRLRRRSDGHYLRLNLDGGQVSRGYTPAPAGPAYTDLQLLRDDVRVASLTPGEEEVVVYEGGYEVRTLDPGPGGYHGAGEDAARRPGR